MTAAQIRDWPLMQYPVIVECGEVAVQTVHNRRMRRGRKRGRDPTIAKGIREALSGA
jgi:hypothetical protein